MLLKACTNTFKDWTKLPMLKRLLTAIVCSLLLVHAIMAFGLVGSNELIWIICGLPVLFLILPPRIPWMVSLSTAFAVLLLAGMLKFTGLDQSIFPSPTAALIDYDLMRGHQIYRPNQDVNVTVPFGDLRTMTTKDMDTEPKDVHFMTDSLGYRNEADYNGEPYIIVGDSFVAASSTNQSQILSAQLRDQGIEAWNVAAVGGDLADYARWIDHTRAAVSKDAKIMLFFFEGNDFAKPEDHEQGKPAWKIWLKRYRNMMRFTNIGKFTSVQMAKLFPKKKTKDEPEDRVLVHQAGAKKLSFLHIYKEVAGRDTYPHTGDFAGLMKRVTPEVAHIFFIPAKWRVYAPLIGEATLPMPNPQLAFLKAHAGDVPVTDLTPAIRSEAKRLLPQGEYVWYVDDTHWNANGIKAASEAVAKALKQDK